MVIDGNLVFSDAQALTASADENSTNVIDTEKASANLGAGTPIWLVVRVNTTFACATSVTYSAQLTASTDSGGTYHTVLVGETYTVGEIVKGLDLLTVPIAIDHARYLKILYDHTTGSGCTAGKVDAYLTLNAPYQT
jgi:hypothetical protein